MNCFDYEASQLADQSTFDVATWTVTTQFANSNDFLERVEAELGLDDEASEDGRTHGAGKNHETSIELSDDAKGSLAAALLKKDNDLADSSHASAKSRCSNFSSSTGNDTNRSLKTTKFALTHKTRALELANEQKKSADLIASQRAMAQRIQELEECLPLVLLRLRLLNLPGALSGLRDRLPKIRVQLTRVNRVQ